MLGPGTTKCFESFNGVISGETNQIIKPSIIDFAYFWCTGAPSEVILKFWEVLGIL